MNYQQTLPILRYLKSIRNPAKKDYAERLAAWQADDCRGAEPSRGALSFMGAQAVQHHLSALHREF